MPSGNFLVGNSKLTLELYQNYIEPVLEERGYTVPDRIVVPVELEDGHPENMVLISIVGEGNLERVISETLPIIRKGIIEKIEKEPGFARKKGQDDVDYVFSIIEKKIPGYPLPHLLLDMCGKYDHSKGRWTLEKETDYKVLGTYQEDNTASQLFPTLAQRYIMAGIEAQAQRLINTLREELQDFGETLSRL